MKFTMARGVLSDALSDTGRGLSSRSTLPILSGILITAETGGTVVFQATDLEVSVRRQSTAAVERPGNAVVPGRLVTDIIRSLPEAAVTIENEGDNTSITCGQASFTVRTMAADDFPRFPETEINTGVSLPTKTVSEVVAHVSKSVSRDETRPILTGVLLSTEGPSLRMVSTDSYRLSVKDTVLEKEPGGELELVVPGRALEEVVKLAMGCDSVEIGVSENQVVFRFGETIFVTRRIEGTFPNWKQLLPKETATTAVIPREEFAQAVKRVSLLAQHNTPLRLALSAEDQTLTLSATTQDVGDASEDLMASVKGEDVEIAFNHAFLADGVSVAQGDDITLEIVSPLKPGVMKSTGDEGFTYLLMPVRLG